MYLIRFILMISFILGGFSPGLRADDTYNQALSLAYDSKWPAVIETLRQSDDTIRLADAPLAAVSAYHMEDYDEALTYLDAYVPAFPDMTPYLDLLRLRIQIAKDTPELGARYKRFINSAPASFTERQQYLELAHYFFSKGDLKKADTLYRLLIARKKDAFFYPTVCQRLVRIGCQTGDRQASFTYFRELLKRSPAEPFVAELLPLLRNQFGDTLKPVDFLPTPSDRLSYLDALMAASQYETAQEIARDFISDFPTHSDLDEVYLDLGMSYYLTYHFGRAIQTFLILQNRFPGSRYTEKACFYQARSYQRQNDLDQARQAYLSIGNGEKSEYGAEAYYFLNQTLASMDQAETFTSYFDDFKRRFSDSDYFNRYLWEQGSVYLKAKLYQKAANIFSQAAFQVPDSDLKAKLLFWYAKTLFYLKSEAKAREMWKKCATWFPFSYYTYRIADSHYLGMTRATVIKKYVLPKIQAKGPAPAVIYQRLYQLGLGDIAADELQYLLISDSANQAQESFDLAWLYDKMGLHSKSISTIARRYPVKILGFRSMPRSVLQLLFPSAFWDTVQKYATQFDLDPYFGMSIMRAESMFKDQVRSRSGAVGLMQIMPATGKGIAERLGVTWKDVPTLLDIDTNIRFGIYYLSTLDTRFNGNLTLMSSGYNAGPNITRKWANDMGFDDIDMFVLNLPKLETENYVYKVLGNYWMYRILYPAAGK